MKARHQREREGRASRSDLPVCRRPKLHGLLDLLFSPPTRLHRYRNLSTRMLEDTLDQLDRGRCE